MENLWKDFVFLDDDSRPYVVIMLSGQPWLCYWNEGHKRFVTLRQVEKNEALFFADGKLPEWQADLYFKAN